MEHVLLNLLPLEPGDAASFEAAAPHWRHEYAQRDTPTAAQLAEAEVILGAPMPPARLGECRKLRLLQSCWSGTDEYMDFLPAGALLCGAAGAYDGAVSEHACALLLAVCHNLGLCRDAQARRVWSDQPALKSLEGAQVLILGAGHIAELLAGKLHGLGAARVVGIRRNASAPGTHLDALYPTQALDELLPSADVLVMLLPDTPQTRGTMTEARLRRMKPDAALINVGRGPSLDLDALDRLLTQGLLWGAGLDVTDPEPLPPEHPLWAQSRCLITPHIAGGFRLPGTREAALRVCLENLERYISKTPLKNISKEG